jgi:hypothetical protein
MPDQEKKHSTAQNVWHVIYWWTCLVMAVLVVPSIAFAVSVALPGTGYMEIFIFIVTCWICTFMGMKLMKPWEK